MLEELGDALEQILTIATDCAEYQFAERDGGDELVGCGHGGQSADEAEVR
jgi:hypothetical protein